VTYKVVECARDVEAQVSLHAEASQGLRFLLSRQTSGTDMRVLGYWL
jgi:hypothetical protein